MYLRGQRRQLLLIRDPAAGLGLPAGWQTTVVDRIGSYSDIFRRTLGAGSPLKLDQGLNRRFGDGGVLVAPFRD